MWGRGKRGREEVYGDAVAAAVLPDAEAEAAGEVDGHLGGEAEDVDFHGGLHDVGAVAEVPCRRFDGGRSWEGTGKGGEPRAAESREQPWASRSWYVCPAASWATQECTKSPIASHPTSPLESNGTEPESGTANRLAVLPHRSRSRRGRRGRRSGRTGRRARRGSPT